MHEDEAKLVRVTLGVLGQQTEMLAASVGGLVTVLREERLLSPAGLEMVDAVSEALGSLMETSTLIQRKFPPGDITGLQGNVVI